MKRSIVALAATACLVTLLGAAAPAHAAFATFVSADGNDANTCLSPATACREIGGASGALSKTDSSGVVHVLPGEYDAFSIPDMSVGIITEGGLATVLDGAIPIPGGGVASILINNISENNVVRIRGLQIESYGSPIAVVGGSLTVHVERCVLAPVGGAGIYGIDFRPAAAGARLFVSDTIVSKQVAVRTAGGIRIQPTGSAGVTAVLDSVRIEDLGSGGLIDGRATTGSNNITIRNSSIAGSSTYGVAVVDAGGGSTKAVIESTTITSNAAQGLGAYGTNVTVRVKDSTISGNGQGLERSGAQLISHGGNAVADNTFNGTFSSTVAPQ